jgi:hypothetical protein
VLAAALAVLGALGLIEDAAGRACWLALVGGLIVAVPSAATGFADWVRLEWGSARWRTATLHLTAMVTAVALFAVAAWLQHRGYEGGTVTTGGLVFVHGVRVLPAAEGHDDDNDNEIREVATWSGSRSSHG